MLHPRRPSTSLLRHQHLLLHDLLPRITRGFFTHCSLFVRRMSDSNKRTWFNKLAIVAASTVAGASGASALVHFGEGRPGTGLFASALCTWAGVDVAALANNQPSVMLAVNEEIK